MHWQGEEETALSMKGSLLAYRNSFLHLSLHLPH